MAFVEYFLLRLALWIGPLVALLALAVGPRRFWRGIQQAWAFAWHKRLDPEEILTQVVRQHEEHVKAVRVALGQAEAAEAAIQANLIQSEERVTVLEAEAKRLTLAGDELGARAALYKINLERLAIENFREQGERQTGMVTESRHRLYLLELQLRQYEVGRSILLSQLAQAEKVEEQYAIARRFDPFNAVANWQKAEGLVQEKSLNARAIERVYADTSELSVPGSPPTVDPVVLEAQLAQLRAQLALVNRTNNGTAPSENTDKPNSVNKDPIQADPQKQVGHNPSDPNSSDREKSS